MKLQKIILCVAIALTAFGASLGLLEIGRYVGDFFQPLKTEVRTTRPIPAPTVVYVSPDVEFKQPVFTPTEENKTEEKEYCKFDETGDYALLDENPKGFKDFDYLTIITRDYNNDSENGIPIKPKGAVWTKKEFKFTWINITGKQISFLTQTKKGVSFQFDGKFVDEKLKMKDANGEEYTETIVLKGRLTKWHNGKKIAEAKVKFTEMCGC